jgi:hypothetical protein
VGGEIRTCRYWRLLDLVATLQAEVLGWQAPHVSMLAFVDLESRVPVGHPIRAIKRLAEMSPLFDAFCAEAGRPSIPPERLLSA